MVFFFKYNNSLISCSNIIYLLDKLLKSLSCIIIYLVAFYIFYINKFN